MTREEAAVRLNTLLADKNIPFLLTQLEALGLLKFEEKKEIKGIFQLDNKDGTVEWNRWYSANLKSIIDKHGTIRLEQWPEGLVLWVGGEIKWKSWETYFTSQDLYNRYMNSNIPSNDKCVSIFGYTLKELAEIIHKNRK